MGNLLIPWHQVEIYQRSPAGFSGLHCYSDLKAPRERCLETRSVKLMRICPLPTIVSFPPQKKNMKQTTITKCRGWLLVLRSNIFWWMVGHVEISLTWPVISGNAGPVHGPTGSSHYTPTKSGPSRNTGEKYHLLKNDGWESLLSFWKRPMFRGYGYVLPFLGRVFGIIGRKAVVKNLTFYWTVNSDFWPG